MRRAWLALPFFVACDHPPAAPPAPATSVASVASTAASVTAPVGGSPCLRDDARPDAMACAQFDSPRAAFLAALSGDARVVAIGEAHAPMGARVPSAARRFTEELLPVLQGRASDLLLELMMPPQGCAEAAAEVREKQAPATKQQAPTNQNEYVALGERARALGIVPDMLRPTCADMEGVRGAGDDAIEASLEMIARLSTGQAGKLIERDARSDADRDKAVVVYGGMLHNDRNPPPERRKWAYAPALDEKTGGKLLAIDLVVPEFMADDATWRGLPWFSHYDRARLGARTTLFRLSDRSFVLIFPETRQ